MGLTLNVSGLKKSYAGTVVLDGCSYRFESGSVYAIMGPNGAGKSTFLRLCALLERPDEGKIDFLDEDVSLEHDLSLRRCITLLLPAVGVFNTSVYENIAYGLKLRKVNKAETEETVLNAAEIVGLKDKLRRRAVTLSSGETQRMGLARALVISPSVLFLDEPTAAVDAGSSIAIEEIIQNITHTLNAAIILSTHDRELADRAADVILTLRNGRFS
ncbi:MAG: ATP-binding cassette domain-containing protein [Nitrospirae bacterium]|nr:ATP-binding cassette domain-containing protein [Nitrospirota bacterium]